MTAKVLIDNHPAISVLSRYIQESAGIVDPDGYTQWLKARSLANELYMNGWLKVEENNLYVIETNSDDEENLIDCE